ncbi:host cell division inhibitor Icd-like protein [Winslowiella toletana]|uniref:host cell division inhibitor Icd-like protein n=1 Tax=Winslowiella toletana TaxID=92490 RepID=UPI0028BDA50A|nr:host cell division inhibitor Icd-like protein [Winslowiella toletana]WNN45449.1 host cell division inhibitor Icd-like protein [Winslowiella toletana]
MLDTTVQMKGFPLARLLAKVSLGNLTKPDIHSAENLALCLTAASSMLCKVVSYTSGAGYHKHLKNRLPSPQTSDYPHLALAKSSAGIGLPVITKATHDAPGVFFCVLDLSHPFFSNAGIIRVAYRVMVGWVVASSEAPVSFVSGKTNSAQSTTSKIGLFGGGCKNHTKEAATMATTLIQATPKFQFRFLALSRADMLAKPCRVSVEAASEKEARRVLAPNFILSLAARLPVQEVAHA